MTDKSTGEGALICIPTYNERENVEKIVPAVLDVLPFANVLVIDDNSPDGTGALGDALANRDDRVHVLHREMKEGLGKAYLAGFAWALGAGFTRFLTAGNSMRRLGIRSTESPATGSVLERR